MTDGGSKDIVKLGQPREVKAVQEADLIRAKGILQRIVGIHQGSISEASPFDRIGEHNTTEIRGALRAVGENLIVTHNGKRMGRDSNINVVKNGSQGQVLLNMHDGFINTEPTGRPDIISLKLYLNGGRYITSYFPLDGETDALSPYWFRTTELYADTRDPVKKVTGEQMQKNLTVENYRDMIRGLRWMSANMLDWDNPEIIMPEQLDSLSLPSSQAINETRE